MRQRGNRSALMAEKKDQCLGCFPLGGWSKNWTLSTTEMLTKSRTSLKTSRHRWCPKCVCVCVCIFSFPWQESDKERLVHRFMNDLHKYVSFIPRAQETKGQHQRSKRPVHQAAWGGEDNICHKIKKEHFSVLKESVPWLQCFCCVCVNTVTY